MIPFITISFLRENTRQSFRQPFYVASLHSGVEGHELREVILIYNLTLIYAFIV